MQTDIGVDIAKALAQYLGLEAAYGVMRSGKLSIDVGDVYGIGIYDGELTHTGTAEHLGGIGSYATDTHNKYMGIGEALHLVIAQ